MTGKNKFVWHFKPKKSDSKWRMHLIKQNQDWFNLPRSKFIKSIKTQQYSQSVSYLSMGWQSFKNKYLVEVFSFPHSLILTHRKRLKGWFDSKENQSNHSFEQIFDLNFWNDSRSQVSSGVIQMFLRNSKEIWRLMDFLVQIWTYRSQAVAISFHI